MFGYILRVVLRGHPRARFAVLAGCALAGLAAATVGAVGWIGTAADRVALANAPQCPPSEQDAASLAGSYSCSATIAGTMETALAGGGTSDALDVTVLYGSDLGQQVELNLVSRDDWDQLTRNLETSTGIGVTMTVWRGHVVSVTRGSFTYPTSGNPGAHAGFDLVLGAIGLVLTLLLGYPAVLAFRQARAQVAMRASTAELARVRPPGDEEPGRPPGYGKPPWEWGSQPPQPGFAPDPDPWPVPRPGYPPPPRRPG